MLRNGYDQRYSFVLVTNIYLKLIIDPFIMIMIVLINDDDDDSNSNKACFYM